jgi:hypothetical protein
MIMGNVILWVNWHFSSVIPVFNVRSCNIIAVIFKAVFGDILTIKIIDITIFQFNNPYTSTFYHTFIGCIIQAHPE